MYKKQKYFTLRLHYVANRLGLVNKIVGDVRYEIRRIEPKLFFFCLTAECYRLTSHALPPFIVFRNEYIYGGIGRSVYVVLKLSTGWRNFIFGGSFNSFFHGGCGNVQQVVFSCSFFYKYIPQLNWMFAFIHIPKTFR